MIRQGHQQPGRSNPRPAESGDLNPSLLSSYAFIDLYLHESPHRPPMVRGLRKADSSFLSQDRKLSQVPEILLDDTHRLYETINLHWAKSGYVREFPTVWRGMHYRCSMLAPPGLKWSGQKEAPTHDLDWVIRHVKSNAPSFDDLRMPSWIRKEIDAYKDNRGLILVGGPFASGKSTLATCAFDYWVSKSHDVGIALEDPPEIPLAKVTDDAGVIYQFDLTDRSVKEAIKNSRRMSPRYVFLGEIRAGDVALELLSIAVSGPLVICTIHASDPVNAITSLFRFAADAMSEEAARDMIASCLLQVFYQEIKNGVAVTRVAKIDGDESHLIKSNIRNGQFRALDEIFKRQEIKRNQNAQMRPNNGKM